MNTQAKHTPTPWYLLPARTLVNIKGPGGWQIGQIPMDEKANAAFIVRAVNSHEELLEACKRFLESSPCKNGCKKGDMTCDSRFAEKAIAKAEAL